MKILILSDSHNSSLEEINLSKYDCIIHCGDYGQNYDYLENNNIYYVCGNCDIKGPKYSIVEIFGKKVLITHGDIENVKYGYDRLVYKSLELGVDICFYGHTHQPTFFKEENILFVNPGSYPNNYVEINDYEIIFYKRELFKNKRLKTFEYKW